MRILRDPAADGGIPAPAPAAPTAPAAPEPAAPPSAAKPAAPNHPDFGKPPAAPGEHRINPIWVAPEDWSRQQNELRSLREFKAEQDRARELAEAERVKLLTDKGQIEEAYSTLKSSYERKLSETAARAQVVEARWLEEKRTAAINEALAGRQFAGVDPKATAAIVRRFLEGEVEAVMGDGGSPNIRARADHRPASDYLKERLESPELAIFFAAQNRGGAGTDGTRPAAATPRTSDDPFADFAARFRAQREAAMSGRNLPTPPR